MQIQTPDGGLGLGNQIVLNRNLVIYRCDVFLRILLRGELSFPSFSSNFAGHSLCGQVHNDYISYNFVHFQFCVHL